MKPTAILTTIPSDSHNWNLIFIELFLKERGYEVKNLGACVPFSLTVEASLQWKPDVIVVSTVNGHGYIEGITLIKKLRTYLPASAPIFIGGKLSTDTILSSLYAAELEEAGYTRAYTRDKDLYDFKARLEQLAYQSITLEK